MSFIPLAPHALVGVRAKLDRSKKHLSEFDAAFLSGDTPITTNVKVISIEEQPEGRYAICSIASGDLPPDVAMPVGDAVHNLRSSLDHLVCQLAMAAGNAAACTRTQFPIFAQNTSDNVKRIERLIGPVSPNAQAAIKALQPYQRRPADPTSDLLWILSELDIIDKHRLLFVARPHFTALRLRVTVDGKTDVLTPSNHPQWQPLKFGTEPFRIRLMIPWDRTKPQTEVKVEAEPMVGVVFHQTGLKCDESDVRAIVGDMIADVTAIVDDFQRFF